MDTYNDVVGTGPGRQLCTLGQISVRATESYNLALFVSRVKVYLPEVPKTC